MNKKIIIWIIGLLLLVSLANARTTPFEQCIRVLNATDGQVVTGLSCNYSDQLGVKPMTFNTSIYCVNIDSSYSNGNYTFLVNCSTSIHSQTGYGEFTIGLEQQDEDNWYYLYAVIVLAALLLLILGYYKEDNAFMALSGILFCVLGITYYIYQFPNFNDEVVRLISLIGFNGIGFFLLGNSALRAFRGEK